MRSRRPLLVRPEGDRAAPALSRVFLRRAVALVLAGAALIGTATSRASGAEPVRIGVLTESWGPVPGSVGLRDGLVALGYREHEQFVIGVRFTRGDASALPQAARELVAQGVDIIFVANPTAAHAARQATSRIPIVFAFVGDPVGLGLIRSFARPGGNITGVTDLDLELTGKRLEVFREMLPGLKRVLFPYDASEAYSIREAQMYRDGARRVGLALIEKPLRTRAEAEVAFTQIRKSDVDGVVIPRHVSLDIPALVIEAAAQRGVPTMCEAWFWVERHGCLVSYGTDLYEPGRQAARLVDKIMRGTPPGNIPVEVDNKVELMINLKVARALGIAVPPELLYRAARVVR